MEDMEDVKNIQTYMIVWDVSLNITACKSPQVDILTPLFHLDSKKITNWIRLQTIDSSINIKSNLSSLSKFKGCTTYMINPLTNTVTEVYEGFAKFAWTHNDWSKKMRFVFELKMQCASTAVRTVIWKQCTTEIKPSLSTTSLLLKLESRMSTNKVYNSQKNLCLIDRYSSTNTNTNDIVNIGPARPPKNWDLLTIILRKLENDVWEWYYMHTSAEARWIGRSFKTFYQLIIFEIKELSSTLKDMTKADIANATSLIKPDTKRRMTPALDRLEMQQLHILSTLTEYYTENKYCDVTVQVQDRKIRAHKVVLAASSAVWRNILNEDETLTIIPIINFEYETIKELIDFMYTGLVKNATEQLLVAACSFSVNNGLKEICEEELIKTIDMVNVANLLVLADQYEAEELFNNVVAFVRENYATFKDLEESKTIFLMYPELAYKLFSKIM